MKKNINNILTISLLILLGLTSLIELANLIGFGTQEVYLNHPDYPEGEQFKKELALGKLKLTLWTVLTIGLLITTILSKIKKRTDWLNWTALFVFIFATYLPIMTIINGLVFRGLIMGIITCGLAGLIIIKMKREKH